MNVTNIYFRLLIVKLQMQLQWNPGLRSNSAYEYFNLQTKIFNKIELGLRSMS